MIVLPVVALMLLFLALVAGWLLVVWLIVKRPILSLPVAVYVGLTAWVGAHDAQALVIYALTALLVWRLVHRNSFHRLVGRRLRSSWRRLWVYDRRWRATMALSGLGGRYGLRRRVPKIRSVRSAPGLDQVLVSLAVGQSADDVERVAPQLANSFGARGCQVVEERPGRVWLLFATSDRPAEPVPGAPETAPPEEPAVTASLDTNSHGASAR